MTCWKISCFDTMCCIVRCVLLDLCKPEVVIVDGYHNHMSCSVFDNHWCNLMVLNIGLVLSQPVFRWTIWYCFGRTTIAYNISVVTLSNDNICLSVHCTHEPMKYSKRQKLPVLVLFLFAATCLCSQTHTLSLSELALDCKPRPVTDNDVIIILYWKNTWDR